MKIEIKNRYDGRLIFSGAFESLLLAVEEAARERISLDYASLNGASLDYASLYGASLNGASLDYASLYGANLNHASLYGASLYGANLNHASLDYASLYGANLYGASLDHASLDYASLNGASLNGANLNGAKGIDRNRSQPLMMLLDQPGQIRAYKLTTKDFKSPISPGQKYPELTYSIGSEVSVSEWNEDPAKDCGAGIHVATLPWCLLNQKEGQKILIVEFTAQDIVCIPYDTSGKFRVKRLKVIEELECEK